MKKLRKDLAGMLGVGMTAGIGATLASELGSTNAATGISNLTKTLPTIGTIAGYGGVLRMVSGLKPRKRRR